MLGFDDMLVDLGVTKDQLSDISKSGKVLDVNSSKYYTATSSIHGNGVFAVNDIAKHDVIGLASVDGAYKTHLGRYTNHSDVCNARFRFLINGDIVAVASENISANTEILIDYRDHVLNKIYLYEEHL